MRFKIIQVLILLIPTAAPAGMPDPKFFANSSFQNQFPGAFALQPESQGFVARSLPLTLGASTSLVQAIRGTRGLAQSVRDFPRLSEAERLQVMTQVFQLQTRLSGFPAPQLVLSNEASRSAFFEFDPAKPDAGKVILNPSKLFQDANPYAALLFLIHETRHSQQFQMAFRSGAADPLGFARPYLAAFTAQKRIFDQSLRTSFCDFLTLNNEYEAFLFGNIVMETLTDGTVDTKDMGTWASQYVPGQGLRIHLPALALKVGAVHLLGAFNKLEEAQYREISAARK